MKVRVSRSLSPTLACLVACVSSLVLLVSGCGSVKMGTPTISLSASPTTISAGASTTLTAAATSASAVKITGSDGSSYTLGASGGTQAVKPTKTTTYTATASPLNTDGTTVTATATVTVNAAVAQPTVAITANPTTVVAGTQSTLTITATNATAVTVTGSDKSSYTITLADGKGTQIVTPTANTTYTATATGATGTTPATATATVTVTAPPPPSGPPTATISVNPTTIAANGTATLTVGATNAVSVTVQGTDNSVYTLPVIGGTQVVTPKTTANEVIYTVTATGITGTTPATASATLMITQPPTVTIVANPTTIASGTTSTLTVTANDATTVTVTGTDGTNQALSPTGGTVQVSPTATAKTTFTYTATAVSPAGTITATAIVTVVPGGTVKDITHVIFMLQENHSFDNYFGQLNPYRSANSTNAQPWDQGDDGTIYTVDGIDDKPSLSSGGQKFFKFSTTCVDDMSSAWEESFWDVNGSFSPNRQITMSGFKGNASGYAQSCAASGKCSGNFTDTAGVRAMGYYDQDYLNWYYYMASQFAVSDRWFSPIASKTIDNRLATFSGGTTQGLVNDPSQDDHLPQLALPSIFQKLDNAGVSWKIYYTVNNALCLSDDDCKASSMTQLMPATTFSYFQYSYQYLYGNPSKSPTGCAAPAVASSAVGDTTNSFCIDVDHIAPISTYYTDLQNGTLPSFAFIEAGFGNNDEHPGSGQPVLNGQAEVAKIVNALMGSTSWDSSVFFFAYDEDGGPYDHVPPVPGHSNDFFKYSNQPSATVQAEEALYPDIGGGTVGTTTYNNIVTAPDKYAPCVPTTTDPTTGDLIASTHCDLLKENEPGTAGTSMNNTGATSDVVTEQGFGAQDGFRVPNMVISPYVKRHYVSHIPMDHTAIIKFVEDRFIGDGNYLTKHDAQEPNLLDFFDFLNTPWATPPTPPTPTPVGSSCHATTLGN